MCMPRPFTHCYSIMLPSLLHVALSSTESARMRMQATRVCVCVWGGGGVRIRSQDQSKNSLACPASNVAERESRTPQAVNNLHRPKISTTVSHQQPSCEAMSQSNSSCMRCLQPLRSG